MRISLRPDEVLQRIRAALNDGSVQKRLWLRRYEPFVGRVKRESFWLQASPPGLLEPRLKATLSQDGFTTLLFVEVRKRPIADVFFMELAVVVLVILHSALLGDVLSFSFILGLVILALLGSVVSAAIFASARPDDVELSFVKRIFGDELLAVDDAA